MTNEKIQEELNLIFLFQEVNESYNQYKRERDYLLLEEEFLLNKKMKELQQEINQTI